MDQTHYDLEERTTQFSEDVVMITRRYKKDQLLFPILSQLLRAGTSIGANYCEANGASSKRDFINKIYICKKEAKETEYWLRVLISAVPESCEQCEKLKKEAHELTLIFSKIAATAREGIKN